MGSPTELKDMMGSLTELKDMMRQILLCEKARILIRNDILDIQFEDKIFHFYLPNAITDIVQSNILQRNRFFEEEILIEMRQYIIPGSVVLDAGTNIGNHTIFFSKICNASKIYCFEPLETVFNVLKKNLSLNNVENVQLYNLALGESKGRAKISGFTQVSLGSTSFSFTDDGDFDVISLDSLNIEGLDFCKIDVEGCQYEFLKGAKNTLEKCTPTIWIEMLDEQHAMFDYDRDHEVVLPHMFLESIGYQAIKQMSPYDYLYIHKTKLPKEDITKQKAGSICNISEFDGLADSLQRDGKARSSGCKPYEGPAMRPIYGDVADGLAKYKKEENKMSITKDIKLRIANSRIITRWVAKYGSRNDMNNIVTIPHHSSYSQAGEDRVLYFLLRDKGINIQKMSYLDIGTNYPDECNNTYLLYTMGARGVCVEADEGLIEQIKKVRPEDKTLNIGVSIEESKLADFYVFENAGHNTFDKEEAEKKAVYDKIIKVVKVPLQNINDLIRDNFKKYPLFLSLDIEGLDLKVLESLDYKKYPIPVMCVETCEFSMTHIRPKNNEIRDYMLSQNYEVYADTYINTIFVNKEWFYNDK